MVHAVNSKRIMLGVEYDGSRFHGWQRQKKPAVPTVQAALEDALSKVADHTVSVICAGRTDAGVHATRQIVHFDTSAARQASAWVRGVNSHLPETVRVRWSKETSDGFHARFTAKARRYQYVICNTDVKPAIFAGKVTHCSWSLDADLMHSEAQCLLGELDFSSFQAVACQSNTPMRNVHSVSVSRYKHLVVIDVQANAFLLHMVRNIAGVLMAVGSGQQPPGWTKWVLQQKDRNSAGITAQPHGLYLVDVKYPDEWDIPTPEEGELSPLLFTQA